MKIRTNFITNSSSSSYVVMYKQMPEIDKETLEKYPFIKNYIKLLEKAAFGESEKITSIEELDAYFIQQYRWRECNTLEKILDETSYGRESYNKYREHIEKGFAITFKEIDYNDESASEMLWSLNDGINFIIEGED